MRETALMDFLSEGDTGAGGEWLPTSEKVIESAHLAEPVTVPSAASRSSGGPSPAAAGEAPSPFLSAPASRFEPPGVGPGPDSIGLRPPGFGPPRRSSADGSAPPMLSAEDLEALEDLTYSELVQARGLDPDALERLGRMKLPRSSAAPAPPASEGQLGPRPAGDASTGSPARPACAPASERQLGPRTVADASTGSAARPAAAAPSRPPVGPSLLAPAGPPVMAADADPAATATSPGPPTGTGIAPARSAPAGAGPAQRRASHPTQTEQNPPGPAPPAETRSFTPMPTVSPPPPDPVVPALARFGGAGVLPRREPPGAAPGSSLRANTATNTPVVEDLPTWPPPGRTAAPSPVQVDKGLGPVPSKYRPDPSRRARRRRFLAACLVMAVAAAAVWYLAIRPRHHGGSADQRPPAPAPAVSAGHPADLAGPALPLRHPGT